MARLYTGTGDDGSTGLFGGDRVSKDHPRVEAYGAVDEFNAAVALAAAAADGDNRVIGRLREMLVAMQSRLFDLGADLATPPGSAHEDKVARITRAHIGEAEAWIDEVDGGNQPLKQFVLPGGSELAARLHHARAICRRAERRLLSLRRAGPVSDHSIIYVNRLSDLLFAMARRANAAAGIPDVPWLGSDGV